MPDDKLISANALIEDLLNKDFYPAIVKRAIEEAPAVESQCEWINAKKQLPENPDETVLCIVSGRYENTTFYKAYEMATFSWDEGWILESYPEWETPEVSWWMTLPEPPKENDNDIECENE